MLLPPTSHNSRGSHRFGRQRKNIGKLARVALLLGGLCAVVSLMFFTSSSLENRKPTKQKQLATSARFLVAAPVLLSLGLILGWWKHRFYGRGQTRRPSSKTREGNDAADEEAPPNL